MAGYPGSLLVNLLKDQADDETTSQPVDVEGRTNVAFFLSSTGTTSGGVVTLEESMPVGGPGTLEGQTYGGTWSAITTVNASTFTGGAQVAIHCTPAAYCFVRARISTAISGGGTVSVGLVAV
jgi:hypothetical protein